MASATSSATSTTTTLIIKHHPMSNHTTIPTSANTTTTSSSSPPYPHPSKLLSRPRKLQKLSPSPTTTTTVPRKPPIPRQISLSGEINTALNHLRTTDPLLSTLIAHYHPPSFPTFQPPFLALSKSILYQQLAFKAGTSVYYRFTALCGGEESVTPETVLSLSPQQLRQIGVSARKASYLHDLARKFNNGVLSDIGIMNMDDKSLFRMLTMVNGIGPWSVHMFMIFSLQRPDVLPVNDLQVRKGVQMLYGLEELPRPSKMEQLCEKWRPFRSVGAWYMWRLVEAKGGNNCSGGGGSVGGNEGVGGRVVSLPHPRIESESIRVEEQLHHRPIQYQAQFVDPINDIMSNGLRSDQPSLVKDVNSSYLCQMNPFKGDAGV